MRLIVGGVWCGERKTKLFFGYVEQCGLDFADGLVGEFVDGVDNVVEECL